MSSDTILRLRILSADFYSATPIPQFDETYNHFRSAVVKQLPIIRVFGITPTGDKACVHIHGVFPYIYIPFPSSTSKGHSLHYEVANSLDDALNTALNCKRQHVFKVSTISSKPFYGYHSKEVDFLKILFYHPSSIKQGINLLQSGAVCNQPLQPHEAHIPYILQFFMDYNLYGMNFLNLSDCIYRCETSSGNTPDGVVCLKKMTNCSVEVDAIASNIIVQLGSSSGLNPGLANIREEEEKRHEDDGVQLEEFTPENSREYIPTKSDIRFREMLASALQERSLLENVSETTVRSQTSTSSQLGPVAFDHEDMSLLRVILGRVVGEDIPDEDSVLGFTPDQDNIEDPDQDLTQPYVSFIVDSDEELPGNQENLSETILWPELDGFSQIYDNEDAELPFVDGNMDEEKTPEKNSNKSKNYESPRYKPLEIKISKSPRRQKSERKQAVQSPKMFKKFEENAACLRNIKSPNHNVTEGCYKNLPSSSLEEPDIILDSDDSEHEDSQRKLKFSLSDNSLHVFPEKIKKLKKKSTAKKVLFKNVVEEIEEDLFENNSTSCISNATKELTTKNKDDVVNDTLVNSELQPMITEEAKKCAKIEGMPEVSTPKARIPPDFADSEELDLDSTNYSQSTITSFYGDTTIMPSQLDFNRILTPALSPPSCEEISDNLYLFGFEKEPTVTPYYSNPNDPSSSKEVGINVISLRSKYPGCLEEFKGDFYYSSWPHYRPSKRKVILEPAIDPPSSSSIINELGMLSQTNNQTLSASSTQSDSQYMNKPKLNTKLKRKKPRISEINRKTRNSVEIDQATPNNSGVFKLDFQNLQDAQMHTLHRYTTLMVLELHINTRADLCPDPAYDEIEAIFYIISNDIPETTDGPQSRITGVIMNCPDDNTKEYPFTSSIAKVASEKELFSTLVELVDEHNPDIISGYESYSEFKKFQD